MTEELYVVLVIVIVCAQLFGCVDCIAFGGVGSD